eukprot:747591-Hanusia_phi.AAC.5
MATLRWYFRLRDCRGKQAAKKAQEFTSPNELFASSCHDDNPDLLRCPPRVLSNRGEHAILSARPLTASRSVKSTTTCRLQQDEVRAARKRSFPCAHAMSTEFCAKWRRDVEKLIWAAR